MTSMPPAPPVPPRPDGATRSDDEGALDTRIRDVERRLAARDAAVGARLSLIGEQLRRRAAGPRLVVPGLLAAGVVGAVVMLVRRPARPAPRRGVSVAPDTGWPWLRLLALAWPLLPARWGGRISPTVATAIATVGVPMLATLSRRRVPPAAHRADGADGADRGDAR